MIKGLTCFVGSSYDSELLRYETNEPVHNSVHQYAEELWEYIDTFRSMIALWSEVDHEI